MSKKKTSVTVQLDQAAYNALEEAKSMSPTQGAGQVLREAVVMYAAWKKKLNKLKVDAFGE